MSHQPTTMQEWYGSDVEIARRQEEANSLFLHLFPSNHEPNENARFGIWTKSSEGQYNAGRATWFTLDEVGYTAAAEHAVRLAMDGCDAYYTVVPHDPSIPKEDGANLRGHKASALWISHVWADIDLADKPDSDKKNYPSRESVFAFLRDFQFPPSMVVETSPYGLHVYWTLSEPLPAQENPDLVARFQDALRSDLGTGMDGTGDLARVLRVPGTVNYNCNPPAMVRVLENWDHE